MGEEKPVKEEKKEKPKKGSGLTISSTNASNTGATISTFDGGETGEKDKSQIYQDPNTGSTIATKQARTNIAKGDDYQIVASTSAAQPKMTPVSQPGITNYGTPKVGDTLFEKPRQAGPKS